MSPNVDLFIRENACNPDFWLEALQTALHCTDCDAKRKSLQNSHDKLKLFIGFLLKENERLSQELGRTAINLGEMYRKYGDKM